MNRIKEIKFIYTLSIEGTERLRVSALKSKKDVLKFSVQFELEINGDWKPVVRYDTAHAYAHKDIIHADGHIEKQPLYFEDLNSAFTFAIEDIKLNWQWYKFAYIKEVEQWRKKKL